MKYPYNIEIVRGETYDKDIEFDTENSTVSLEGKSAKGQVRPKKGDDTLSADFYCTVSDDAIHINLSSDKTEALKAGEYEYDVWLIGTGFRKCYIGGKFIVHERVTVIDNDTDTKQNVTITIIWNDDSDAAEARPEFLSITLLADGKSVGTAEVSAEGNTWTYTFENMPVYSNNVKIVYTANGSGIYGYDLVRDGLTLTYTYNPSEEEPTEAEQGTEGE